MRKTSTTAKFMERRALSVKKRKKTLRRLLFKCIFLIKILEHRQVAELSADILLIPLPLPLLAI